MMSKLLAVSSGPHIHSGRTVRSIMGDVLIALAPVVVASVLLFGLRALILYVVCVGVCVACEWVTQKLFHKPISVSDLSAAVTGVILACNLPVNIPLWMAAIGCIVAIFFTKQLFGGIGSNIANPAIVGRIVLMISFPSAMSNFILPNFAPDGMASATVLPQIIGGSEEAVMPGMLQMFFGIRTGCAGETCIFAILLGFAYLVYKRVIHLETPIAFVATYLLFSLMVGNPFANGRIFYELMGGGLLFGAVFMMTDYPTTPGTRLGRVIFGFGCGLITFLIRFYGSLPEGVSFGILLMNMLTPLINRLVLDKPFGWAKPEKKEGKA